MFSPKTPLGLGDALPILNNTNQVQILKASGNQPRPVSQSPNVIAQGATPNLPAHVTGVQAVAVKANDSTSKVTVSFSRNPNDYFFVDARVFVAGYKGNPAPVQMASGQSPVSFALENTGDPVNVIVQASGNLGQAPLSTAPNTTLKLVSTPLATVSTPGGTGPGAPGTGIAGYLAKWATNTTLTNTDLSGDVYTTGTPATVVQGIQTVPVATTTPVTGDGIRYNPYGDSKWDITSSFFRWWGLLSDFNNGVVTGPMNGGAAAGGVGTISNFNSSTNSHTEPIGAKITGSSGASTNVTVNLRAGANGAANGSIFLENILKAVARVKIETTTNARYWITLQGGNVNLPNSMAADVPNSQYAGFRYSAGVDTTWKAVCATDNTHQTVVDTGIALDTTNSQLFEMWYDGTNMNFKINNSSPVQVTTNLPTFANWANGLVLFLSGDNKNTANATVLYFYYFVVCMK